LWRRIEANEWPQALERRPADALHLQQILERPEATEPRAKGENRVGALLPDAGEAT
jgi:hypothetical protein